MSPRTATIGVYILCYQRNIDVTFKMDVIYYGINLETNATTMVNLRTYFEGVLLQGRCIPHTHTEYCASRWHIYTSY